MFQVQTGGRRALRMRFQMEGAFDDPASEILRTVVSSPRSEEDITWTCFDAPNEDTPLNLYRLVSVQECRNGAFDIVEVRPYSLPFFLNILVSRLIPYLGYFCKFVGHFHTLSLCGMS